MAVPFERVRGNAIYTPSEIAAREPGGSTEPDQDVTPTLGAALAVDPSAEIARLRAHLDRLAKEHARHSLAVSAHKARADQQESRAIHAETQLARFATYIEQYDKLAEMAGAGQRATDLVAELRRRLAPMERLLANLRSAEAALANSAGGERERIAQVAEDLGAHYHDDTGGQSAPFADYLRGRKSPAAESSHTETPGETP